MKKICLIMILILSVLFMFGCNKNDNKGNDKIEKKIEVVNKVSEMEIGETLALDVKFYLVTNGKKEEVNYTAIYGTSNALVLRVEKGALKAYQEGVAIVYVYAEEDADYEYTFTVEVKKEIIDEDPVINLELTAGEIKDIRIKGDNIKYVFSNDKLAIGDGRYILALREGNSTVSVYDNNDLIKTINLTVKKYVAPKVDDADLKRADDILKTLTLEQKIGQMFIGSNTGTSLSKSAKSAISDYHLGNYIYMGYNCTAPLETSKMSVDLQNRFKEANGGIPGFISIDQETGTVNRMNIGATRFLGNMATSATNDPHNAYLVGEAVGEELKYYGINFDLAPVLDVNNNPLNPIINCRSYSDNPIKVARFGTNMINGLKSQNVMSCSKHFPGHGNTSTDSHLDLPTITSSLDDLYKIELAPFIASIYNGIDAIMTTHIVFSCLDTTYPATLSKTVLSGLLREDLGYEGLIVTDALEMSAITKGYGKSQAAILAIKAGADILCYTSVSDPMAVIPDVISAVNNGEIDIKIIDKAVERILLKKIKYGLFEEVTEERSTLFDVTSHIQLNQSLAKQSVTVYTDNFNGLDKTKNTIIMSSTSAYELGYSGNQNSFGYYCSKYLKEKGMKNCDYDVISSISNSNKEEYINKALDYDQIVIAIDSANEAQISFVNELAAKRDDIIVVALKLPYDYNYYENVNTFITIYDRTPIMIEALTKLMNGEYHATGVCPVELDK